MDVTDMWGHPWSCALMMVWTLLFAWTRHPLFLVAALVNDLAHVAPYWPDVPNHSNLIVFLDVIILMWLLWDVSLAVVRHFRHRGSKDGLKKGSIRSGDILQVISSSMECSAYHRIMPLLPFLFSVLYWFAGFHKLNYDFFTPPQSCVADFTRRIAGGMGIQHHQWLADLLRPDTQAAAMTVLFLGAFVILWELGCAVLVWSRRWRPYVLGFIAFMHMNLALAKFVNFSSLINVFILAFLAISLPHTTLVKAFMEDTEGKSRRWAVWSRVHLYVYANLLASCSFWLIRLAPEGSKKKLMYVRLRAAVFIVSTIHLLATPLYRAIVHHSRQQPKTKAKSEDSPPPPPVSLSFFQAARRLSCLNWVYVLLMVLFYLMPYLGLRTAGCATMFSNLQIESVAYPPYASRSNHLLVSSDALRLFSYTDDLVYFHSWPSGMIGRKTWGKMTGQAVPLVEVHKMVRKAIIETDPRLNYGLQFAANFSYYHHPSGADDDDSGGWETRWVKDIRKEELFTSGELVSWWEMRLLSFRPIPFNAPKRCYW
mmetsp:Transcript_1236/g.3189  ORF Transcript_1236/g.3189 Transcript_1236/m.3189 type:complete len:539 (+) Transcript_1236:2-1618(+)